MAPTNTEVEEWAHNVDEVSAQIKGIIDGTISDFDEFDRQLELKDRVKRIREEEKQAKRERFFLNGQEGKGEGQRYKWWCKRCFVEYMVDLPNNTCTRCKKDDMMMTQVQRREELMGKLQVFKEEKARHQFRKDKWLRWKKSQAMLKRSRYINYKAWEYWEPDTETEDEGDPIVPRHNPEFLAMEADMKDRTKKRIEKHKTARKMREKGNEFMKAGDYLAAIESYDEGLEYRRDDKSLWTNKALAEIRLFRWHDAIASCNKVIEYAEIFEEGFTKSADACYKAFVRRAMALRALHRWDDAVMDLEDALKLYPKERECKELLEKTKAASEEARRVRGDDAACDDGAAAPTTAEPSATATSDEEEADEEERGAPGAAAAKDGTSKSAPAAAAPERRREGPVRVAIEESDEDDDDGAAGDAESESETPGSLGAAGSLAGLTKREFDSLLGRLQRDSKERARFCLREAVSRPAPRNDDKWVGRKLDITVEEVAEPSGLDGVLKDAEKCRVMWRKAEGKAIVREGEVPKRVEVAPEAEPEEHEAAVYLNSAVSRVLQVLYVLATNSDNHCELSAHAIRNVWPLMSFPPWRYAVLELLMEWSQRSVSAKAMAECAARNASSHLTQLVEAITQDTKENVLPPGFEEITAAAGSAVESGKKEVGSALEDVIKGLTKPTATELAVGVLGNLCLIGQNLPTLKENMLPFCDRVVDALSSRLRAFDWRLCGRTAGALANFVRLGPAYATAVHERCAVKLVGALREELKPGGPNSVLHNLLEQGGGQLPITRAKGRLLSALVNLVLCRPQAAATLLDEDALTLVLPLVDVRALSGNALGDAADDATPLELANRAALLLSKLVAAKPASLLPAFEEDLLRRLRDILGKLRETGSGGAFAIVRSAVAAEASGNTEDRSPLPLELLDLAARLLTTVLVKIPGALARVLAASERSGGSGAPWELSDMVALLLSLAKALLPPGYVSADAEGGLLARTRGNVALILAAVAEAQAKDDAAAVLRRLDLAPLVPVFIECLRRERGQTQHNIGVCVTRLAQNQKYRSIVRDLNGLETLHQVQLPRVERQKEEAMRLHRIRGIKGLD